MKIGIIGYGDFTKVLITYLSPYASIVVSSRQQQIDSLPNDCHFGEVDEVLAQDIIIPSIPAQALEGFFTNNLSLVNPKATIIDVCSVKTKPLETLTRLLPASCQIIGTHPMFGPASVAQNNGLKGLPIAICPVRQSEEDLGKLRHFLADTLQLKVIETTPDRHDRDMAYVQGLSHYIGRVMDEMAIPESELSTFAYDNLMAMRKIQGQDSWDLFESIIHENPYASAVNEAFIQACQQVNRKIDL